MKQALVLLVALTASLALAANPPDTMNYQGVLRNASDAPLTGNYDIVFRFFDAATGGNEIALERHTASSPLGQVAVAGGLFSVTLGSRIEDGAGAGTYGSLSLMFDNYSAVWLELQVGGETLAPRVSVTSTPWALNALKLGGLPRSLFLNTQSEEQTKQGRLILHGGPAPGSDGNALTLRQGNHFNTTTRDQVLLSYFPDGLFSHAIKSRHNATSVEGNAIDYFLWTPADSSTDPGTGHGLSITATGVGIGTTDPGSRLSVLDNRAGDSTALIFNSYGGTAAYLAGPDYALRGSGQVYASGYCNTVACPDAYLAGPGTSGWGVYALGGYDTSVLSGGGGYFRDKAWGGEAKVGFEMFGVQGRGLYAGGYFADATSGNYALVGFDTWKIQGTGAVSFVQNHPDDPSKVIVYTAPESSDVATFTRGTAQLVAGEARVALDPTFAWVTNPEIGLTVHLTPRGDAVALAVRSITSESLVVVGPPGSDASFDYLVFGLRLGFEQTVPVQPKQFDASIPSMKSHRDLLAAQPELARYAAGTRFRAMAPALAGGALAGRADQLRQRVHEFDPATDSGRPTAWGAEVAAPDDPRIGVPGRGPSPVPATAGAAVPSTAASTATASRRDDASRRDRAELVAATAANLVPVSSPIEAGEVVATDPAVPGSFGPATLAADRSVAGIAGGEPGTVHTGAAPIAMAGTIMLIRVDATVAPIAVGDLLSSSPIPGRAMHSPDAAPGTVVAKALEPLAAGTGTIRALVMAR